MPRKTQREVRCESPSEPGASQESEQAPDPEPEPEPPTIEPYATLNVARSATADEIKAAYRKAALKHHPDKAPEEEKAAATATFQSIAFAYAILSSPSRRAHYDATGALSPSSGGEDFNWSAFYAAQYRDIVTPSSITRFSLSYKGSAEERADVLAAYVQGKGRWAVVYETVLLSDCLVDEGRFRDYIDEAMEKGEVPPYQAYTGETARAREKRMAAARREAAEADAEAEDGRRKKEKKGGGSLEGLAMMIQRKNADAGMGFLDGLERKYKALEREKGSGPGAKRKKKAENLAEPDEAAFQAAAARLGGASRASAAESRGSKRAKK
ncbi:unnamed protein product [Diplocarpon coronariae]|uniref:J domain-containing protein n=1 Tax=Diplocarpon coronariae TaxID=2795749 RepID=A0A218Z9C6_9HELO|nr:hypothetical protein B2J93_5975 [Marssonina coronariae]